jgi:dinuclear metal center YbgI/SA1388 family protein
MTKIEEVVRFLDGFAPFSTALSYDNVGLLVGDGGGPVTRALLSLDITGEVVQEAHDFGAELVVSHHPVIFSPLKYLSADSVPYLLARYGIAALCAHTNLDMAPGGVNDCLADRLGVRGLKPLSVENRVPYWKIVVFVPVADCGRVRDAMAQAGAGALNNYRDCSFTAVGKGHFTPLEGAHPAVGHCGGMEELEEARVEMLCAPECLQDVLQAMRRAHPYEEPAFDVFQNNAVQREYACALLGELAHEVLPEEFAAFVKVRLGCRGLRYFKGKTPIRHVAVCCGAGGDQVFEAIRRGADALVTGEVKHHEWIAAKQAGLTVVDAGHYKTEAVVLEPLRRRLAERFPQVAFRLAEADTDGIGYLS